MEETKEIKHTEKTKRKRLSPESTILLTIAGVALVVVCVRNCTFYYE